MLTRDATAMPPGSKSQPDTFVTVVLLEFVPSR